MQKWSAEYRIPFPRPQDRPPNDISFGSDLIEETRFTEVRTIRDQTRVEYGISPPRPQDRPLDKKSIQTIMTDKTRTDKEIGIDGCISGVEYEIPLPWS